MSQVEYTDRDGQKKSAYPVVIVGDQSAISTEAGSKTEFTDDGGRLIHATPLIVIEDYRENAGGSGGGALPPGGTDGQVLTKVGSLAGDVAWHDPTGGSGLPDGGTTGQVLRKASNANGDASWAGLQASDITGLGTAAVAAASSFAAASAPGAAVSAHASAVNAHTIAGISGLQTALDDKASVTSVSSVVAGAMAGHSAAANAHSIAGITGLQATLNALAGSIAAATAAGWANDVRSIPGADITGGKDSTAIITAALNGTAPFNKPIASIYVPAGCFLTLSDLPMPANSRLWGEGTILYDNKINPGRPAILANNASYASVVGLKFRSRKVFAILAVNATGPNGSVTVAGDRTALFSVLNAGVTTHCKISSNAASGSNGDYVLWQDSTYDATSNTTTVFVANLPEGTTQSGEINSNIPMSYQMTVLQAQNSSGVVFDHLQFIGETAGYGGVCYETWINFNQNMLDSAITFCTSYRGSGFVSAQGPQRCIFAFNSATLPRFGLSFDAGSYNLVAYNTITGYNNHHAGTNNFDPIIQIGSISGTELTLATGNPNPAAPNADYTFWFPVGKTVTIKGSSGTVRGTATITSATYSSGSTKLGLSALPAGSVNGDYVDGSWYNIMIATITGIRWLSFQNGFGQNLNRANNNVISHNNVYGVAEEAISFDCFGNAPDKSWQNQVLPIATVKSCTELADGRIQITLKEPSVTSGSTANANPLGAGWAKYNNMVMMTGAAQGFCAEVIDSSHSTAADTATLILHRPGAEGLPALLAEGDKMYIGNGAFWNVISNNQVLSSSSGIVLFGASFFNIVSGNKLDCVDLGLFLASYMANVRIPNSGVAQQTHAPACGNKITGNQFSLGYINFTDDSNAAAYRRYRKGIAPMAVTMYVGASDVHEMHFGTEISGNTFSSSTDVKIGLFYNGNSQILTSAITERCKGLRIMHNTLMGGCEIVLGHTTDCYVGPNFKMSGRADYSVAKSYDNFGITVAA